MKKIFWFTVTCLFIALLTAQAQQNPQPQRKESSAVSKAQIHDGLEITVLSFQRTKEREGLPNFPQKMRAEKGHEFATLTLKVKTLESGKMLDVRLFHLYDVNGNSYKCIFESTDLCDSKPGNERTCDLPFTVQEGIQLNRLQIGEISFDLKTTARK